MENLRESRRLLCQPLACSCRAFPREEGVDVEEVLSQEVKAARVVQVNGLGTEHRADTVTGRATISTAPSAQRRVCRRQRSAQDREKSNFLLRFSPGTRR